MPSGWLADPSGRHEKRYFNGEAWTDRVLDGALHASDPIGDVTSQPHSSAHRRSIVPPRSVVAAARPAGNGFAVAGLTVGIIAVVMALAPSASRQADSSVCSAFSSACSESAT